MSAWFVEAKAKLLQERDRMLKELRALENKARGIDRAIALIDADEEEEQDGGIVRNFVSSEEAIQAWKAT